MFRADAALIVTWYNTASAISGRSDIDAGQTATYQVSGLNYRLIIDLFFHNYRLIILKIIDFFLAGDEPPLLYGDGELDL